MSVYARGKRPSRLNDHSLLLNGLQSTRLSGERRDGDLRPAKRQRTDGLNSRFDRMIRTVNIMHVPATTSSHSSHSRRSRAESSSSGVTYDSPTTPLDPRDSSDNGNLGEHFSVLKMKSLGSVRGIDPFDRSAFGEGEVTHLNGSIKPLPTWLEGTITTLNAKHPLRVLLPDGELPCEEPDLSMLDTEPDAVTMLVPQESPFAFAASTESPRVTDLPNSYVTGLDDVRQTLPPTSSHRAHPSSPDYNDMTPSMLPFSTPGPTFAQSTRSSTMLDDPSLYSDHHLSEAVPFWQPGHFCPPGDASTIDFDTEQNIQTSSPASFADESFSYPARHPLHVSLPFSTPGPNAGLPSSEPSISPSITQRDLSPVVTAPGYGASLFSPAASSWQYGSLHSPLRLAERCLTSRENSSDSLGRLFNSSGDGHLLSGSIILPSQEPCNINVDYEALGFKWNRFDRGDIILDAASSSLISGDSDSEEIFWQQQEESQMEHALPRENAMNSSPASLRLTGISTPPILSPGQQSSIPQVSQGRPRGNPSPQKSADTSPFAWAAASPVEHVPCTLRSDVLQHNASLDGRSYGPECSPPGKPFAPAPGIYISPLRNQSGGSGGSARTADHDHGEGVRQVRPDENGSGGVRARQQAARSPQGRASVGAHEDATSTYEIKIEEDISQSPPKTFGGVAGAMSEDEDEIEDFTTECSQETHDTIESWTD